MLHATQAAVKVQTMHKRPLHTCTYVCVWMGVIQATLSLHFQHTHTHVSNGHRQRQTRRGQHTSQSRSQVQVQQTSSLLLRGVLFSNQVIGNSFAYTLPVLTDAGAAQDDSRSWGRVHKGRRKGVVTVVSTWRQLLRVEGGRTVAWACHGHVPPFVQSNFMPLKR